MGERVEVDSDELTLLRQAKKLADSLWDDESIGMTVKKRVKEKFPTARIPELDIAKPYDERLAAIEKRLEEREKLTSEEKLQERWNKEFSKVKNEFNLTDEGMDKVHKLIQETHEKDGYVLSPRAAAAQLVHDTPIQPLEPSGMSGRWDFMAGGTKAEEEDMKAHIADPDAWLERQIQTVLSETRGKNRMPIGGV